MEQQLKFIFLQTVVEGIDNFEVFKWYEDFKLIWLGIEKDLLIQLKATEFKSFLVWTREDNLFMLAKYDIFKFFNYLLFINTLLDI